MKRILLAMAACMAVVTVCAQPKTQSIKDINIRDPFIVADASSGVYYMYRSSSVNAEDGTVRGGVEVFRSRDLENWEGPVRVMTVPADNWITGRVWAPEVHRYKGYYYMFATINSDIEWKKQRASHPAYTMRGTQIFRSKSPEGPFEAFEEREPATPMDEMALDAANLLTPRARATSPTLRPWP